jgi:hypothetical protein
VSTKQAIYNYDALGRLKEVTFSTGGKITYTYDAMGNRSSVVQVAAGCCFDWKGAWNSGTSYNVGDAVSHDGSSYLAVTDNTNSEPPSADWDVLAEKGDAGPTGATGSTGATGAKGLNWRGTWSSVTAYVIDDAVTLNGTSYVAVANNTNSSPPSANWNTLAAKGDTGATGSTGSTGADGAAAHKSVIKGSDTSRTTNTTLTDDPDLSIALEANTTYHFYALFTLNQGGGQPGFKMTFVGPSGSTISWSATIDSGNNYYAGAGGTSQGSSLTSGGHGVVCTGSIVVGSTAGNLKLQWAQNTSHANAATIKATALLATIRQ